MSDLEGVRIRVGVPGLPGGGVTSGELEDAIAGLAPANAKYIVQTADAGLSAEQALGALATGILKNTTTTGVLSIATGSDLPSHTHTGVAIAMSFVLTSGDPDEPVPTGAYPEAEQVIPVNCTITSYQMVGIPITGETIGSAVVDLLGYSYSLYPTSPGGGTSIITSGKPTIASARHNSSSSVAGWTTALTATDYLKPEVESCTDLAQLHLTLFLTRSV